MSNGKGSGETSAAQRISDDNSDNPADSCTPNNAHNWPKMVLWYLLTHFAWSWRIQISQCHIDESLTLVE